MQDYRKEFYVGLGGQVRSGRTQIGIDYAMNAINTIDLNNWISLTICFVEPSKKEREKPKKEEKPEKAEKIQKEQNIRPTCIYEIIYTSAVQRTILTRKNSS